MASPLASFELRKATEADLIEWGNVAGLAFAFKGGDPGRFLANHLADAEVAPAAIRLALKDGKIAAAIRVIPKSIYIEGKIVTMYGIGDVCTHPDFQRQGAAAALMSYIIDEFDAEAARGKGGRIVSTLHAIESMRPFYAKYGYTAVQAHRSLLRMNIGDAGAPSSCCPAGITLRRVCLPADAPALSLLYSSLSSSPSIMGAHTRSPARLSSWTAHVVGHALWLAQEDETMRVLAYGSARYRRGETSLAEFGCAPDLIPSGLPGALLCAIIAKSVIDVWGGPHSPSRPPSPTLNTTITIAEVVCPLPIAREVLGPTVTGIKSGALPALDGFPLDSLEAALSPDPSVSDSGWMYRDIVVPEGEAPIAEVIRSAEEKHMIWTADFF